MKHVNTLLYLALLASSTFFSHLHAGDLFFDHHETFGKTFYNPRSPGLNQSSTKSSGVARFIGPSEIAQSKAFSISHQNSV